MAPRLPPDDSERGTTPSLAKVEVRGMELLKGASPEHLIRVAEQDPAVLPADPWDRVAAILGAVRSLWGLITQGGVAPERCAVVARLLLSYARGERTVDASRANSPYNASAVLAAISSLAWEDVLKRLSHELKRDAADTALTIARPENLPPTDDRRQGEHGLSGRDFAVLQVHSAFEILCKLIVLCSVESQTRKETAFRLFRWFMADSRGLREDDEDHGQIPSPDNALDFLARSYLFRELQLADRRAVAHKVLDVARAVFLASAPQREGVRWIRTTSFLAALEKSHVLRQLDPMERERAARIFWRLASGVFEKEAIYLTSEGISALGHQLLFTALPPSARADVAGLMLQHARQEIQIEGPRSYLRSRLDPRIDSIKGLAREYVFRSLPEEDQRDAAVLIFRYATGDLSVEPGHVHYQNERGWMAARKRLHRSHILDSLPADRRADALKLIGNRTPNSDEEHL